jgi:hypothetical protein
MAHAVPYTARSCERRFPPPWSAEVQPNHYVVRDANRQQLAYVYYENEPGRRSAAKLLSKDEARRSQVAGVPLATKTKPRRSFAGASRGKSKPPVIAWPYGSHWLPHCRSGGNTPVDRGAVDARREGIAMRGTSGFCRREGSSAEQQSGSERDPC